MATTYTLIASATANSDNVSLDFTSIPNTYTDLLLRVSARSYSASGYFEIRFNDSTSSYSNRQLYGNGSSAASNTDTLITGRQVPSGDTASTFSNNDIYIPNYAGSTNKSVSVDAVNENNGTTALASLYAGLWSNTAAITKISITGINVAKYTTAYLYGITKA